MAFEHYFHGVTLHLLTVPAAVADEAARAARGEAVPSAAVGFGPRAVAASWTREVLRPELWPPDGAPFLFFAKDRFGACDAVRCFYEREAWTIEVAQSKYILTLGLRGASIDASQPPVERASRVAKLALALDPDELRFREAGDAPGLGAWGEREPPASVPGWPDWKLSLKWWTEPARVGFVALKLPGGPTQELITYHEASNVAWTA